jgi:hypothetical protein
LESIQRLCTKQWQALVRAFHKPLTDIEIYKVLIVLIICMCTASAIAICAITDTSMLSQIPLGQSGIILGHLGAEHFCITKALVSGRGFADPFCIGTGPTAWMYSS